MTLVDMFGKVSNQILGMITKLCSSFVKRDGRLSLSLGEEKTALSGGVEVWNLLRNCQVAIFIDY